MPFVLRRAEPSDAAAVHRLITESNSEKTDWTPVLERRFGKSTVADLGALIDTCSFTAVAVSPDGQVVYGFLAASEGIHLPSTAASRPVSPAKEDRQPQPSNWFQWVQDRFECPPDFMPHNVMFLRLFVADPLVALEFTYEAFTALFSAAPRLEHVGYMLPHGLSLFAPFTGPRYLAPGEKLASILEDTPSQAPQKGQLHLVNTGFFKNVFTLSDYRQHQFKILSRSLFTPKLMLRKARVEDCDDLVPMFKRHKMLDMDADDYHISRLIECPDDRVKTLVAEVAGKVVGFMSLSSRVHYDVLAECYHLEAFESILTEVDRAKQSRHGTSNKRSPPKFFTSVMMSKSLEALGKQSRGSMNLAGGSKNGLTTAKSGSMGSKMNLLAQEGAAENPSGGSKAGSLANLSKITSAVSNTSLTDGQQTNRAANIEEPDQSPVHLKKPIKPAKSLVELALDEAQAEDLKRDDTKVPNAFCITLFCIDDHYAAMSSEFLSSAFAAFPDRDYILLTLPTNTVETSLLNSFTRVPHRWEVSPPHCLYLAYRFSMQASVSVRQAVTADSETIYSIIQDLPNESDVVALLKKCRMQPEDIPFPASSPQRPHCLVAEAYGQIVGIVTVDYTDPMPYFDQYDVEDYISIQHPDLRERPSLLRNFILNPLFMPHSKYILGEVCRMVGSTVLFYPMESATRHDLATRQLVLKELVPVKRRRRIDYPNGLNDGKPVSPTFPYALRFFGLNLLHEPRLTYNSKVVIVGASDTGIAIAEQLVYTPHLNFTNISVVSLDGIPTMEPTTMFVDPCCYTQDHMRQLGLENYVNDITGRVTGIDRDGKQVLLADGSVIPYDYLLLASGLQYYPEKTADRFPTYGNVYGMNRAAATDIEMAIRECVQSQYWPEAGETVSVVYGNDEQAYTTVESLITAGVQPHKIAFVVPPLEHEELSVFENAAVDAKMQEELKKANVRMFHGKIVKWTENEDSQLKSVFVKVSEQQSIEVSCHLLLYSHLKTVNTSIFKAINSSCLVFDERLVVDGHFRTHDPSIFAAGSLTKYSVKYKTKWSHENYDSRNLANKLLETFDPLTTPPLATVNGLPHFTKAKIVFARLIGGYIHFHMDRPHLQGDILFEKSNVKDGAVLVRTRTDADDSKRTDLQLFVDRNGYIQGVSYLGKKPISVSNYSCIYGLHEKYLNQLLSRFQDGMITDLTEFLDEEWAFPLYHDRFGMFLEQSRRQILELAVTDERFAETKALLQQLREFAKKGGDDNSLQVAEELRRTLFAAFDQSTDRKVLDAGIRDFLKQVVPQE